MTLYAYKTFIDNKPEIVCVHSSYRKDIKREIIMQPWKTIDKKGKMEAGVFCPKCYRSVTISL